MYEVNTISDTYRNSSAASVARVAVAWKKAGRSPSAYAIFEVGGKIECRKVAVTTVRETTEALEMAEPLTEQAEHEAAWDLTDVPY